MNSMGLPVEQRILHDGQVLTVEAFVARRLHPANAGRVLTGIRIDVDLDLRVVGHDGATSERYPAVPVGHMPSFAPPKSHRAADPRLPGNKTARTTEPERE